MKVMVFVKATESSERGEFPMPETAALFAELRDPVSDPGGGVSRRAA